MQCNDEVLKGILANMNTENNLIIDIDDAIASLVEEINALPSGSSIDFAESIRTVVIDAIMGPFGLSASVFEDQDGGRITTDHNFQAGVVASEADKDRYEAWQSAKNRPFDRSGLGPAEDYDHRLRSERKETFRNSERIEDGLTGRDLPKDGRAHRDHVVPAAQVERSSKANLAMTREQRVSLANEDSNLTWTHASLNQSAGMRDKLEWAETKKRRDGVEVSNAEHFDVDMDRLRATHAEAKSRIDSVQNLKLLKKQAGEFVTEGGSEAGVLAVRQIVGIILKDLATGLIEDVKTVLRKGFRSVEHLLMLLRKRLNSLAEMIITKWMDYLADGLSAALSGLMSTLVTLVINSFLTTAKRVVTIIRESTLAVVRSIKMIVAPPAGFSANQVAIEVLKLLSGGLVASATLLLQEAVAKAIETVPLIAPFAQDISGVLVAILGGGMGLLTVLFFDRVKSRIAFHNKALADLHRGHAVALLKVMKIRMIFNDASLYVSETTERLELCLVDSWASINESAGNADESVAEFSRAIDRFRSLEKGEE